MDLHPLIQNRRSLRAIDPGKPIAQPVIDRILEAARWAPSTSNMQPWRFVVAQSGDARARAVMALRRGNQTWAANAPAIFVICANPEDDLVADGKPYYLFDCGLAAENLILQGIAEGLVMHPMLGWYEEPMRDALEIPASHRIVVVIAAGHPAPLEALPEELQQKEMAERVRKPLSEIAFYDRWSGS